MVTYEEAQQMLENIIDEFPSELFNNLSGGVILKEEAKLHTNSRPERPLYVMGEYHRDSIGKYITMYYGSFARVCSHYTYDEFRKKLRHTFSHELRHHIEHMAGVNTLNKFDDERMAMYENGTDISQFKEPPIK